MRTKRAIGWTFVLCMVLSVGILISPDGAEAKPKVTTRYYNGNTRIKYYSIVGSKYKKANAEMKKYANAAYATNQGVVRMYQEDRVDMPEASLDAYYFTISPKVKYSSGGKLSILYTEKWFAGGVLSTNYKAFNFYKGKTITLMKAFKSKEKYSSANNKAQTYWRLNWSGQGLYEEPMSSETRLAKHQYYWTKKGLTVVYEAGSIGSFADGERRYAIPKSYLKY